MALNCCKSAKFILTSIKRLTPLPSPGGQPVRLTEGASPFTPIFKKVSKRLAFGARCTGGPCGEHKLRQQLRDAVRRLFSNGH